MERDKAKNERLTAEGWKVIRLWEHELKDIEKALKKIHTRLASINCSEGNDEKE